MDRDTLLTIGVAAGVAVAFGIPIGLGLFAYRRLQRAARARLESILAETAGPPEGACGPAVDVLCYAYYGFLATLTTVRIERRLPPERAYELLERVHGFNLRWGWFAAGGLFVPLASLWRRARERRRIRRQMER
jgi:hypothetical protein